MINSVMAKIAEQKFNILTKNWNNEYKDEHRPIRVIADTHLIVAGPSVAPDPESEDLYKVYNLETGVMEFETRALGNAVGVAYSLGITLEQIENDYKEYRMKKTESKQEKADDGPIHH